MINYCKTYFLGGERVGSNLSILAIPPLHPCSRRRTCKHISQIFGASRKNRTGLLRRTQTRRKNNATARKTSSLWKRDASSALYIADLFCAYVCVVLRSRHSLLQLKLWVFLRPACLLGTVASNLLAVYAQYDFFHRRKQSFFRHTSLRQNFALTHSCLLRTLALLSK